MNRAELQQLAEDRLLDVHALLAAGRWSAAYYLAGQDRRVSMHSSTFSTQLYWRVMGHDGVGFQLRVAAMKSIVRRDTGEDWNDYLVRLMQEQGLIGKEDARPSDEELRKFDKRL